MDQFIVSARKYRPSRFEDVIGQPQVTNTLKNAIKTNQLAQAFLFCGPRGVGKTTCARILAKVINCENITADTEACNECASCKSFNDNASFNVHELDAASNNSVDDIRNLTDQVRYAPQAGKKKIYIIDEVHMLSTQAFNAFLKTLEEPPPYAIFILATTEKHKIIPTILSRCQIFDFNRIKVDDMQQYLQNIASRENIFAEPDALHIISQKADGALRDALSIFDRISIFSGGKISYNSVIENLNILDYDYFFKLTDSFLNSDTAMSLITLNEIFQKGFEGDNFILGLAEHFRNLLVLQDSATLSLLETSENLKKRYAEQAAYTPASFLINGLSVLNDSEIQYRQARNKRLLTEFSLIKLCHLTQAIKIARQQNLEEVKKKTTNQSPITTPQIEQLPQPKIKSQISEAPAPSVKAQTIKSIGQKLSSLENFKKDYEEKHAVQTKNEEVAEQSFDDITSTEIKTFWPKVLEQIKAKGNHLLYNNLTIEPESENNAVILFAISQVQLSVLEDYRNEIAMLINESTGLKNVKLILKMDLTKVPETTSRKPYTPIEKFNFMIEKNPAVKDLKEKLDLEIDF